MPRTFSGTSTAWRTLTIPVAGDAALDRARGTARIVANRQTVKSIASQGVGVGLLTGGTPCR